MAEINLDSLIAQGKIELANLSPLTQEGYDGLSAGAKNTFNHITENISDIVDPASQEWLGLVNKMGGNVDLAKQSIAYKFAESKDSFGGIGDFASAFKETASEAGILAALKDSAVSIVQVVKNFAIDKGWIDGSKSQTALLSRIDEIKAYTSINENTGMLLAVASKQSDALGMMNNISPSPAFTVEEINSVRRNESRSKYTDKPITESENTPNVDGLSLFDKTLRQSEELSSTKRLSSSDDSLVSKEILNIRNNLTNEEKDFLVKEGLNYEARTGKLPDNNPVYSAVREHYVERAATERNIRSPQEQVEYSLDSMRLLTHTPVSAFSKADMSYGIRKEYNGLLFARSEINVSEHSGLESLSPKEAKKMTRAEVRADYLNQGPAFQNNPEKVTEIVDIPWTESLLGYDHLKDAVFDDNNELTEMSRPSKSLKVTSDYSRQLSDGEKRVSDIRNNYTISEVRDNPQLSDLLRKTHNAEVHASLNNGGASINSSMIPRLSKEQLAENNISPLKVNKRAEILRNSLTITELDRAISTGDNALLTAIAGDNNSYASAREQLQTQLDSMKEKTDKEFWSETAVGRQLPSADKLNNIMAINSKSIDQHNIMVTQNDKPDVPKVTIPAEKQTFAGGECEISGCSAGVVGNVQQTAKEAQQKADMVKQNAKNSGSSVGEGHIDKSEALAAKLEEAKNATARLNNKSAPATTESSVLEDVNAGAKLDKQNMPFKSSGDNLQASI